MRIQRVRAWMALVLWCGGVLSSTLQAADPLPWEAEAFSASPEATLQAASQLEPPKEQEIDILLEETKYQYDADRRVRKTHRQVYRVLTEDALEGWATVNAEWAPWHQERPQIKARVISTDGLAHELDPATITEGPADQGSGQVFRDRRQLIAPLPAVEVGAVVEWQIVIAEHRPFCEVGTMREHFLHAFAPIRNMTLIVESPEQGPPLQHRIRGSDVTPQVSVENGLRRLQIGPLPVGVYEDLEGFLPYELPLFPHAVFSNGSSWADVARHYARVVDTQIGSQVYTNLAREIVGDEQDRLAVVRKLTDAVQKRIRYVGIEFGESTIVPHTPDETLKVRYGDCKDQSTLLVALLRALGHKAHVALLRVGRREDLLPEIPALNTFDHAIVYVPGEPPLWIDPTAPPLRVGELPLPDQNRLALIASPDTTELVHTPQARSSDNSIIRTREMTLRPLDQGQIVSSIEYRGVYEIDARSAYTANSREEAQSQLQERLQENFDGARVTEFEYSDPRDLSAPFRMKYTAQGVEHGVRRPTFTFHLEPDIVLEDIPWPLLQSDDDLAEDSAPATGDKPANTWQRKRPLHFNRPQVKELHCRVRLPVGFRVATAPEPFHRQIGPVTISAELTTPEPDLVVLVFRFDSGDGRLTPDEARDLRAFLAELRTGDDGTWPANLELEHLATQLIAREDLLGALAEFRRVIAQHPDNLYTRVWYVEHLVDAGQVSAARIEALRTIELHPQSEVAWATLGYARMSDDLDEFTGTFNDRLLAEEALRKALELKPDLQFVRWNLAISLEYGPGTGYPRYVPGPRLQEAIEHYRHLRDAGYTEASLPAHLHFALTYADRWPEVIALAAELEPSRPRDKLWLAALAMTEGAARARAKATELEDTPENQRQLILDASETLNATRHYAASADLLESIRDLAPSADFRQAVEERVAELRSFSRLVEAGLLPADDPRQPVQQLHLRVFAEEDLEAIRPLFIAEAPLDQVENEIEMIRAMNKPALGDNHQRNRTRQRRIDAACAIELTSQGDASTGYRIAHNNQPWYVVSRNGELRLLPSTFHPEWLGLEALRCLNAGDEAAGRLWLEWSLRDIRLPEGLFTDPFSVEPIGYLWNALKRNQPKVAAAILAVRVDPTDESQQILAEFRASTKNKLQQLQVDRALARRYGFREEWESVIAISDQILESRKNAREPLTMKLLALVRLKRVDESEALWKLLSKLLPDVTHFLILEQADLAGTRGDYAEADKLLRAYTDLEPTSRAPDVANSLAWNSLFLHDPPQAEALEQAVRANELSEMESDAHLHTLATVHAELNHPQEARKFLLQAIALRHGRIKDFDYYVLGRIAESCGFPEVAAQHYNLVKPDQDLNSTYHLAQRRLQKLRGSD